MERRWKETTDIEGFKTWYRPSLINDDPDIISWYEIIKLIDGKYVLYEERKPWREIPKNVYFRWNSNLAQAKDTWKRINQGRLPYWTHTKGGNRVKI